MNGLDRRRPRAAGRASLNRALAICLAAVVIPLFLVTIAKLRESEPGGHDPSHGSPAPITPPLAGGTQELPAR